MDKVRIGIVGANIFFKDNYFLLLAQKDKNF
jgi:hypothetical protein